MTDSRFLRKVGGKEGEEEGAPLLKQKDLVESV